LSLFFQVAGVFGVAYCIIANFVWCFCFL